MNQNRLKPRGQAMLPPCGNVGERNLCLSCIVICNHLFVFVYFVKHGVSWLPKRQQMQHPAGHLRCE